MRDGGLQVQVPAGESSSETSWRLIVTGCSCCSPGNQFQRRVGALRQHDHGTEFFGQDGTSTRHQPCGGAIIVEQFGLDEALSDGVRREDQATSVVVDPGGEVTDSGGEVDQSTTHGVLEGQDAFGLNVDDAEDLVCRGGVARRSLSVVVVELREYLQQTTSHASSLHVHISQELTASGPPVWNDLPPYDGTSSRHFFKRQLKTVTGTLRDGGQPERVLLKRLWRHRTS